MAESALIYLRLSVDRTGEAESIDRQEAWARKTAKRNGWTISEVFTERDASASRPGTRPVFGKLLERVQAGNVEHVVAWRSDRLWRHVLDQQAFMSLAAVAGLKSVVTSDEGVIRVGSDDDEFRSSLNALLGGRESKVIARRVAFYEADLAARGLPHAGGMRPFGFEPDKLTHRANEATAIRDGYAMALRGETMYAIAAEWNSRGLTTSTGQPFITTTARKVLMSARNAGLREHHGEVIGTAAWAPIVDRETWEATCSLVRSRRSTATGRPARTNALAGMLRCPCGAVMVAGSTGKRRPGVYAYTCRVPGSGHVSVSATVAENEATAALWAALGVREAELAVEVHTAAEASVDGSTVSDAVRGLDTARARTEELEAMFAEGELTRPEYVRMRSRARERLDAAETALRTVATVPTELPRLGDVRAVWDDLTPDEQRTIYRSVFAVFRVTAGGGRWSTVASRLVPLTYPE